MTTGTESRMLYERSCPAGAIRLLPDAMRAAIHVADEVAGFLETSPRTAE